MIRFVSRKRRGGARDLAELLGPIVAFARINLHLPAAYVQLGAIAVDLDLVDPFGAAGCVLAQGGVAGLDESWHWRPLGAGKRGRGAALRRTLQQRKSTHADSMGGLERFLTLAPGSVGGARLCSASSNGGYATQERFHSAAVLASATGRKKPDGGTHAWVDLSHRVDRGDHGHPFGLRPALASER